MFFNFNKAYDYVPRDKLTHKLITIGRPYNIVELINNMLKIIALSIGKETIRMHKGINKDQCYLQYYLIYIKDLMIMFQAKKIETRAYADYLFVYDLTYHKQSKLS